MTIPIHYRFIRDVTPHECRTLPRAFKAGEVVQRKSEPFGLCRDDASMGVETVPCTLDGSFVFTVPVSLLRTHDGYEVTGDYIV